MNRLNQKQLRIKKSIKDIPNEILDTILTYIEYQDWNNIIMTCKLWAYVGLKQFNKRFQKVIRIAISVYVYAGFKPEDTYNLDKYFTYLENPCRKETEKDVWLRCIKVIKIYNIYSIFSESVINRFKRIAYAFNLLPYDKDYNMYANVLIHLRLENKGYVKLQSYILNPNITRKNKKKINY